MSNKKENKEVDVSGYLNLKVQEVELEQRDIDFLIDLLLAETTEKELAVEEKAEEKKK